MQLQPCEEFGVQTDEIPKPILSTIPSTLRLTVISRPVMINREQQTSLLLIEEEVPFAVPTSAPA